MAVVNELITSFGFKGNIAPLKDFNKELGSVIPKLTKFALASTAVGIGISKIITSKLVKDNPLVQFNKITDESVQSIQSLELASVKFGASVNSSFDSIRNLTKGLAEARLKGNEAFGQFGITIVNANNELKKAPEILKDINRLFNSTNRVYGELADKRQKLIVLQTLGIKEDLLPLLMLTTKEYNKQVEASKQLALSDEQVKSIRDFNNELNRTNTIIEQIGSLISANISDEFKSVVSLSGDFLKTNKETVLSISDIAVKVGLVAGAVGGLILVAKGLAVAFGTALAPVLAVSASLVASYEIGKKLVKVYETLSKPSIKAPPVTQESARNIVESARGFGGVTANQLLGISEQVKKDTYTPAMFKNPPANVVHQTNNIKVVTDNPAMMQNVIEDTINRGARIMQETSKRGGI